MQMTLLLTEGFDWLQTSDLPNGYGAFTHIQIGGTMTDTIENAGGRNGGKSLKIIPGVVSNDDRFYLLQGKGFPLAIADGAEVIFGVAVKITAIPVGDCTLCGMFNVIAGSNG